jgi:ParB-like chromosome segregation protein Spo0J
MQLARIEMWDPNGLNDHPLNAQIYGDEVDAELVESIRTSGVLVPLTVTSDLTVISGHRRRKAAIAAGLSEVPCIVQPIDDPDLLERALIESNRQRTKTNEQRAREAARLLDIEKRLAAKRVELSQAKPGEQIGRKGVKPVSPPTKPEENADSGKSRERIGKVVGMSGPTVTAAVEVVQKIDEAKAAGDTTKAEKLTATLNTKGVKPALREARQPAPVSEEDEDGNIDGEADLRDDEDAVTEAIEAGKEFDRINRDVRAIIRRIKELAKQPCGAFLDENKLQEIEHKFDNALSALAGAKPYARCPYCLGAGCHTCRKSGCVTRMIFDNAPEAKRKAVKP